MTTHTEARNYAHLALVARFNCKPTEGEIKALTGVACLETSYGDGWKGAGKGSHNMGAIQCGSSWRGDRFSYVDTHPNPDGSSTRYQVDFRKYHSIDNGWADLVNVVFINRERQIVRSAAQQSDWYGVSKALHQTGYYEGFGKTAQDRILNHYRSLSRAIAAADKAAMPSVPVVTLPDTVRFGSTGESVKLLQSELRLAADGIFGKLTKQSLVEYQRLHGLTADGVCGPKTWVALFADDYQPEAK